MALHAAARAGDLDELARLAGAAGADLEAPDKLRRTALHLAAHADRPESVGALHALGANLAAFAQDGYTALHAAAEKGAVSVAKALLQHKDFTEVRLPLSDVRRKTSC